MAIIAILLLLVPANGAVVTLSDVPSYYWYHGCEPTSVAMVLGYWDLHGYPNLFNAQGADVYLTANVQDEISSPAHNAKYDPTPDAPGPAPPYTSIADWCGTSVDQLSYGASLLSKAGPASVGYSAYKGYAFESHNFYFSKTWDTLVGEINAGRPMIFGVDSDGDGLSDHAEPVLGYDDRGVNGLWYEVYTTFTESESPVWFQYQAEASGVIGGVYGSVQVIPDDAPVSSSPSAPEPSTFAIFVSLMAMAPIFIWRRRKRLAV